MDSSVLDMLQGECGWINHRKKRLLYSFMFYFLISIISTGVGILYVTNITDFNMTINLSLFLLFIVGLFSICHWHLSELYSHRYLNESLSNIFDKLGIKFIKKNSECIYNMGLSYGDYHIIDSFRLHLPLACGQVNNEGEIVYANDALREILKDKNSIFDMLKCNEEFNYAFLHGGKCVVDINNNICTVWIVLQNNCKYIYMITEEEVSFNKINIDDHSHKIQMLGQLTGGIAHDFNNLLTAIIGFCDLLLLRHVVEDPSFEEIMQIKQNAKRAAELTSQLLKFSRKEVLEVKVVDLKNILFEATSLVRRLVGEGVRLEILQDKELWKVKIDRGQLEQVLVNLVVNARDAMNGKGILSITTANEKVEKYLDGIIGSKNIKMGEYVTISITDNGCGVCDKDIAKIFDPFFSYKKSGTGLGLSTVYRIVDQSFGYILVDSTINSGTTVKVFLPKCEDVMEEIKLCEEIDDLSGDMTILLVEDELPVRICSEAALKTKGYEVIAVDNAKSAMDIIKNKGEEIDLVITDVVMPDTSGPELVKEIREFRDDIKVIFISGYSEEELPYNNLEWENSGFLSKPFTLEELAKKVKIVTEGKKIDA